MTAQTGHFLGDSSHRHTCTASVCGGMPHLLTSKGLLAPPNSAPPPRTFGGAEKFAPHTMHRTKTHSCVSDEIITPYAPPFAPPNTPKGVLRGQWWTVGSRRGIAAAPHRYGLAAAVGRWVDALPASEGNGRKDHD